MSPRRKAPRRREAGRCHGRRAWRFPLLAVGVYFIVGSPRMIEREAEHMVTAKQVEAMVARLAARLRENPNDVDGWRLLGRSYSALQRFRSGRRLRAGGDHGAARPAAARDFADALAMARGQSLQGEPEKLVLRALEIDPKNLKALARSPAPRPSSARISRRRPTPGSACSTSFPRAARMRARSRRTSTKRWR
jgi:hypothetical protein